LLGREGTKENVLMALVDDVVDLAIQIGPTHETLDPLLSTLQNKGLRRRASDHFMPLAFFALRSFEHLSPQQIYAATVALMACDEFRGSDILGALNILLDCDQDAAKAYVLDHQGHLYGLLAAAHCQHHRTQQADALIKLALGTRDPTIISVIQSWFSEA
jgi:hypothetical protein